MKLTFGTAGLRATMGEADDQLNIANIRTVTRAVAMYLKQTAGSCDKPKTVIAYDSRNHSEEFAREAARIFALEDCDSYIFPKLSPTPSLSFAVRHMQCDAGIVITASHNPAEYNGYKVFGPDGGQITEAAADAISRCIEKVEAAGIVDTDNEIREGVDFHSLRETGAIHFVDDSVMKSYLKAILKMRSRKSLTGGLKVVYTPLHGAGLSSVVSLLKYIGVEKTVLVNEQCRPDGDFPTCPYPNPENPSAMALGLQYCEREDADILLATDPDSDRIGVAAKKEGRYEILSGNQVGVLMLDYLISKKKNDGVMPEHPVIVKTIVSSSMADRIAEANGIEVRNVLTGFKYIGEQIGLLEEEGRAGDYLLGFEESCGYLIGSYCRDKDAVGAAMLICEMADALKTEGKTLWERMEELSDQYGYFDNVQKVYNLPVSESKKRMAAIREYLKAGEKMQFDGALVNDYLDYMDGVNALPASDVLQLQMSDGSRAILRPSGTEPKLKVYWEKVR